MNKTTKGILRIGTSGIVVPGTRETRPVEFIDKSRLNYYSSLFNTLEVNSSFHKLPLPSTFKKWSLDVPADFQFTVKLWKEVTHIKKLKTDLSNIEVFLKVAEHIEEKGCLLVQFPGSITLDFYSEVEEILSRVQELDRENSWRKAVEFRSTTWYVGETAEMLNNVGAAMVLHDMPKSKNLEVNDQPPFFYFRFHGPTGNYKDSYSENFLEEQAVRIHHYINDGKDVYAYFNNTMGSAYENAISLRSMIERKG